MSTLWILVAVAGGVMLLAVAVALFKRMRERQAARSIEQLSGGGGPFPRDVAGDPPTVHGAGGTPIPGAAADQPPPVPGAAPAGGAPAPADPAAAGGAPADAGAGTPGTGPAPAEVRPAEPAPEPRPAQPEPVRPAQPVREEVPVPKWAWAALALGGFVMTVGVAMTFLC